MEILNCFTEVGAIFQAEEDLVPELIRAAVRENIDKALITVYAILKFQRNDLLEPAADAVEEIILKNAEYQDVKNLLYFVANRFVDLGRREMIRRESVEINQPPKTRTVFPGVVVLPTGKCSLITQEEETEFYN